MWLISAVQSKMTLRISFQTNPYVKTPCNYGQIRNLIRWTENWCSQHVLSGKRSIHENCTLSCFLEVLWILVCEYYCLSAGLEPSDIANTTKRQLEASSLKLATCTWCIICGLTRICRLERTPGMLPGTKRDGMRLCITQFRWFSTWIPG